MILRRTGDALEKSNRANRVMNVLIIALAVVLVFQILSAFVRLSGRLNRPTAEIEPIGKIEQRIGWNGVYKGLDIWANGPYGFAEDAAHRARWALSEYYAERFLEEARRRIGDDGEADAAHARAALWAAQIGGLSTEEAEAALAAEVWP